MTDMTVGRGRQLSYQSSAAFSAPPRRGHTYRLYFQTRVQAQALVVGDIEATGTAGWPDLRIQLGPDVTKLLEAILTTKTTGRDTNDRSYSRLAEPSAGP